MKTLVIAFAVLLTAKTAFAARAIMEQTAASNNTIYVDTTNARVGISTATPKATFDVAGNMQVGQGATKSTFTAAGALNMASGAGLTMSGTLTNSGAGGVAVTYGVTAGSITVPGSVLTSTTTIFNGGNVGIGTSNPSQAKLQVNVGGATSNTSINATDTDTGGGVFAVTNFSGSLANAVNGDTLIQNSVGNLLISPNAAGKSLKFIGGLWSNAVSMSILDGGNVGVGTVSPATKLHMSSGVFTTDGSNPLINVGGGPAQNVIGVTASNGAHLIAIDSSNNKDIDFFNDGTNAVIQGSYFGAGPYPGIAIKTAAVTRVLIDSSGNVGVGPTSPQYRLHVSSGAMFDGNAPLRVVDPNGTGGYLVWGNGGSAQGSLTSSGANLLVGATSNSDTQIIANNAAVLTAKASGNVGIGTTSPASALHVVGVIISTGVVGVSRPEMDFYDSGNTTNNRNCGFKAGIQTNGDFGLVCSNTATDSPSTGNNARFYTDYTGNVSFGGYKGTVSTAAVFSNGGIASNATVEAKNLKLSASAGGSLTFADGTSMSTANNGFVTSSSWTAVIATPAGSCPNNSFCQCSSTQTVTISSGKGFIWGGGSINGNGASLNLVASVLMDGQFIGTETATVGMAQSIIGGSGTPLPIGPRVITLANGQHNFCIGFWSSGSNTFSAAAFSDYQWGVADAGWLK